MQANVFQVLKAARAERRLRFTSAIFHHLSAIKIQRALRAHWALESAKKQIHSVITIQVESQNIHSATSIEEYNSFYKWHLDFFFYFIFFFKATGESEATEKTLSGVQAEGGYSSESSQALASSSPQGCDCHPAGCLEIPPPQASEEGSAGYSQGPGTVVSAECGKDVACNSKGESRRFPIQSIFRCPKFIQPSVTSVRTAH